MTHPEIEKIGRYDLPDAATAGIILSYIVTIIAPGPNGRDFWDKSLGYIIAVNGAVKVPIAKDIWIVADGNAVKCPWFKSGCENFKGFKVFSEAIHVRCDEPGDYTFWLYPNHPDQVEDFWKLPFVPDPDFFRPTETVTGIAIDFAVRHGAREINLIGVDCDGGYFYDAPGEPTALLNPVAFAKLNEEIKYFQGRGIKIRSISSTKLEI